MEELLSEDVEKLIDAFKVKDLASTYLVTYHTHVHHPEVFSEDMFEKLAQFSDENQKLHYLEKFYPELSRRYTLKQLASRLSDFRSPGIDDPSVPVEAREQMLAQAVRR